MSSRFGKVVVEAAAGKSRFADARGAKRVMAVCERFGKSCWAESAQTAYITPGLVLTSKAKDHPHCIPCAPVGAITPKAQSLGLKVGDTLILTRSLEPGRPAQYNEKNELVNPPPSESLFRSFLTQFTQWNQSG